MKDNVNVLGIKERGNINEKGDYLFVSNCGHDSVTTFEVDLATGMLTAVDNTDTDEKPVSMILFLARD